LTLVTLDSHRKEKKRKEKKRKEKKETGDRYLMSSNRKKGKDEEKAVVRDARWQPARFLSSPVFFLCG